MKNNDTLVTILGIIFTIGIILFSFGFAKEINKPSYCPEANCYTEIYP